MEYSLGFKLYTDGDLYIDKYEEIDLDNEPYTETYFLVKTWNNFDDAIKESIKILEHIYENIGGRDFDLKPIKNRLGLYINKLKEIKTEDDIKHSIYTNYETNQIIDIQFTGGKLYKVFREYKLLERLEAYVNTLEDVEAEGECKRCLEEILKGKEI